MKKFLLMSMLLPMLLMLSATNCHAGLHDDPTIAVLPFVNKAPEVDGLRYSDGSAMSEIFINELFDTDRFYNLVEREQLRAVINETAYNNGLMVDPNYRTQVGRQLGAQYLVAGSLVGAGLKESGASYDNSALGSAGGKKFTVEAKVAVRIIEVETGRIVLAFMGHGKSSSAKAEFTLHQKKKTKVAGDSVDLDDQTYVDDQTYTDQTYTDQTYNDQTYNDQTYTDDQIYTDQTYETIVEHTLTIGAERVSNIQVINAVEKAIKDAINNKDSGMLAKMDGTNKRRGR